MTRSNFFYQKLRKGCPISYAKFQHDPPHSSGFIAENLRGGVASTPPPMPGRGLRLIRSIAKNEKSSLFGLSQKLRLDLPMEKGTYLTQRSYQRCNYPVSFRDVRLPFTYRPTGREPGRDVIGFRGDRRDHCQALWRCGAWLR